MAINITFITPHLKLSGGTKVITKLASMLNTKGRFNVQMAVDRENYGDNGWIEESGDNISYNIVCKKDTDYEKTIFDSDIVINYADSNPYMPLPSNLRHVLLLQGFGTQQSDTEYKNLSYRYDAVIATSEWLADIAIRFGHTNVYKIPPGIDPQFKPVNVPKSGTVIGSLYHHAADKNINFH